MATCCTANQEKDKLASPHSDDRIEAYLQILNEHKNQLGSLGDASKKEIEIVSDANQIQNIANTMDRPVGIVIKDRFFLWLNDPVKFPNGKYGIYSRLIYSKAIDGCCGVGVLAVLPDGRVVLNYNYRHATRSWEFEMPRGMIEKGESISDAAKREAKEETGMEIGDLRLLGNMAVDTGLTNAVIPIFIAKVIQTGEAHADESEAIEGNYAFTVDELKQGYLNGFLEVVKEGDVRIRAPLRDSFLAYALFLGDLNQLLPK